MKALIIILSLMAFSVSAETRILIPLYTDHIGHNTYEDAEGAVKGFNEKNHGLGIEQTYENYSFGVTYLANNSYGNRSVYLSAVRETKIKDFTLSAGFALASGYDLISDTGLIISPLFAVQYGNIRIVTSYPGSALTHPDDQPAADFVNVQFVCEGCFDF